MNITITLTTEAEVRSVRAGLANWINNLHHRIRLGNPVDQGILKINAAQGVLDRLDAEIDRQTCLETQHRFLIPGETIEVGDEILEISRFQDPRWHPCRTTVGYVVRDNQRGEFRRAV